MKGHRAPHSHKRIARYLAGLFLLMCATWQPAMANDCTPPKTAGHWVNKSATQGMLSQLVIQYRCDAPRAIRWRVRARTKCPRRDCTWGYAIGKSQKNGDIVAEYSTFVAVRQVTMSTVNGLFLNVKLFNDHHDPERKDEIFNLVMERK